MRKSDFKIAVDQPLRKFRPPWFTSSYFLAIATKLGWRCCNFMILLRPRCRARWCCLPSKPSHFHYASLVIPTPKTALARKCLVRKISIQTRWLSVVKLFPVSGRWRTSFAQSSSVGTGALESGPPERLVGEVKVDKCKEVGSELLLFLFELEMEIVF